MKTKLILLGLLLIVLSACTAEKIALDEMTITDPEQFKQFKTEPINISTKESVKVFYNYPGGKNIVKEKVLICEPISNYQFTPDSIFVDDTIFHSIIAIKALSQIHFKGLLDNEIGFVSEDEINSYYSPKLSKAGGTILGAIAGGTIGTLTGWLVGVITGTKINFYSGSRTDKDNINSGLLIGGILGSIIGGVFGVNLFSSEPKNIEQILVEIKRGRK